MDALGKLEVIEGNENVALADLKLLQKINQRKREGLELVMSGYGEGLPSVRRYCHENDIVFMNIDATLPTDISLDIVSTLSKYSQNQVHSIYISQKNKLPDLPILIDKKLRLII